MLLAEPVSGRYLLFFLAAGIWGITSGILFRMGRLRGLARYYSDPVFPYFARNIAFSQIPGGVAFLLWFAAGLLWSTLEPLAIGLTLSGLLSGGMTVLVTLDPPEWLKPQWMRAGESWDGGMDEKTRVVYDEFDVRR